jgi:hypothetical protein
VPSKTSTSSIGGTSRRSAATAVEAQGSATSAPATGRARGAAGSRCSVVRVE